MPIATHRSSKSTKSTKQSQENEAMQKDQDQDETITQHVDDGADVNDQLDAAAEAAEEAIVEQVEDKPKAKRGKKAKGDDATPVVGDEKFIEAIASFEVASRVENNAWADFVRVIAQRKFLDSADFNGFCKDQEAIYKQEYNVKGAMPAKYRSAKSTVLKAMNAGVSLVDDDNNPIPKTELTNRSNRAVREATPPVKKSAYDEFKEFINKAHDRYAQLDSGDQKLALQTIKNLFQGVCK